VNDLKRLSSDSPDTFREYRRRVRSPDLVTFRVTVEETDLLISAETDLSREMLHAVWKYRRRIEAYIDTDPGFKRSLSPYPIGTAAPRIVRAMAGAADAAGVGPMAAVAGAIAEFVGRDFLQVSPQIIVENGGDIFLATNVARKMSIFTKARSLPHFINIMIRPEKTPLGVCTSSGREGPSLSLGRADAVTVVSPSAALADAAATAAGNLVRSQRDVEKAIEFLRGIPHVTGAVVLAGEKMGFWGEIELMES